MNANELIASLKAENTPKDNTNLANVLVEYKNVLNRLPPKDRPIFSLNVLCVLCRNLNKAPKWRDRIDNKELLMLSIDCVRETRPMEKADRVKTLACVYTIHRHIVKQDASIPPQLVLKISFMPFELDTEHLLAGYSKTYWNILVDRLSYIEKLRNKIHIIKLLPKLTEDILKIIKIYDTVQFCTTVIIYLVKKLHFLYNEMHSDELNRVFCEIFTKLSEKDLSELKKCDQILDVYIKLNECLYVIAENSSKNNFKDSALDGIVRCCITIVAHRPDLVYCFQNFHLNSFCSILTEKSNSKYTETVLKNISICIEMTKKLGYENAMNATYPFLNQFLRLFIEYNVSNSTTKPWKDHFGVQIQGACLELMQKFMKNLKICNQQLKCENCKVKTGLHDALRLSFQVKHFVISSTIQNIDITDLLPTIHNIITQQYEIMSELKALGCVNYEKCFLKLQTDIHNTAIILNKANYFESSIQLFEIYLKNEFTAKQIEKRNIGRALYNKSICELDAKLYVNALINAYLSIIFSKNLNTDKGMSLVVDIKAKEVKSKMDDAEADVQSCSIIDACEIALKRKMYGDLLPFLKKLKFSELLRHEFSMYAQLWPSLTPVSGVWRSLLHLTRGQYGFIDSDDDDLTWTLYEVVLETPSVVRSMNLDHFNTVITEMLDDFENKAMSLDVKVVYSSLLLLKSELELAAASDKYGWRLTEPSPSMDPDRVAATRTVPQEHAAAAPAVRAVSVLVGITPHLHKVSNTVCLQYLLQISQVSVVQLLHLSRLEPALQLAVACCKIADCINNDVAYVQSVGTLLYHGVQCTEDLITRASQKCAKLAAERDSVDAAITFMCDAAIYYLDADSPGVAARLTRSAQVRILNAFDKYPDINLDLAMGRLLEAQLQLCSSYDVGPGSLSAAAAVQRHYLAMTSTGTTWHTRRLATLTTRHRAAAASVRAARLTRALQQWRRGRAGAAAGLPLAGAVARARLYGSVTDVNCFDDAQIKIDNRLKHVLGLQPSNETQPYYVATESKTLEHFTPKAEIETMLENLVLKKAVSPSITCSVPAFKIPDFIYHDYKCSCYACDIPITYIIACEISGLEAAMYFKAKEDVVARNYFNGVVKMINLVEERLKNVQKKFAVVYDNVVLNAVMKYYWEQFSDVHIEILIELAYFEMKNKDFDVADEHIVEIHEILKKTGKRNQYMINNISNLMACAAQLRKTTKKPTETGLEAEFDGLKLSPVKYAEAPKTPENKPMKIKPETKVIVKDEELPKKRKVIKLNFNDENDESDFTKKPDFQIPVRVPSKHLLEAATPITRSKPKILVTQPSKDISTPNIKDTTHFFTPKETPDQFFTPMASAKTYKKQSLRENIIKNLEMDFSTPHSSKENANLKESENKVVKTEKKELGRKRIGLQKEKPKVTKTLDEESKELDTKVNKIDENKDKSTLEVPSTSRSKVRDNKKTLKRATSPGKLCKEGKESLRSRRLRKPVNFSVDEEDNR